MASRPKLQPSIFQPPEVSEKFPFGFWGFSYIYTNVPSLIKIEGGAFQGVAELTWNDPRTFFNNE